MDDDTRHACWHQLEQEAQQREEEDRLTKPWWFYQDLDGPWISKILKRFKR